MDIYAAAGVDYDVLDAGKRAAVSAAAQTTGYAASRGAVGNDASRGETAFCFQLGNQHLATVLECLGTKSTIARQVQDELGINRFDAIGYDTVAAAVNDLVCVGAMPLVVNAYFATGAPDWYRQPGRFEALVAGFKQACEHSGAMWGGGESPGLSGIVEETEIDLAASATGAVAHGVAPLLGDELHDGDDIVLVSSTGLHANGSSLARKIASHSPDGWATKLPSGRGFGEAVLDPSAIYVSLVENLLADLSDVTYLSHITGHGFRKLMRANAHFTYRITEVPPVPEVLRFMVDKADMTTSDAYGTFNMGAGFAVMCRPSATDEVLSVAKRCGFEAWRSGTVEAGERKVVIEPLGVTYLDQDLQLR